MLKEKCQNANEKFQSLQTKAVSMANKFVTEKKWHVSIDCC